MASFKASKVVSVLPEALTPDTLYLVRAGAGFDLYCSDATGSIAHQLNAGGSGGGASMGDVVMSASPTQYTAPDFLPLSGETHSRSEYPALAELFPSAPFDAPIRLADPASPGAGATPAISPDGNYLAVGITASPFLAIYKRSGEAFVRLPNPTTLPPSRVLGLSWSPDSTYLSAQHNSSPFVSFYKRTGDTLAKLANPATLPASMDYGANAFSPDGALVVVRASSSGYTTYLYARTGDTLTFAQSLGTAGYALSAAWSPDGSYLAIGSSGSSYNLEIFKRVGNTLTRIALFTALSTAPHGLAWSGDGSVLYMAGTAAPYLFTYRRIGDAFASESSLVDVAPVSAASWPSPCAVSADGGYLALTLTASPFLLLYKIGDNGALTRLPNPAAPPPGSSLSVSFSKVGHLALGCPSNAPHLAIYTGDVTKFMVPRMSLGVAAVKSYIKT